MVSSGFPAAIKENLIVDVGMHDGADSAFYLAKGFEVVAIEPNPVLAQAARERFAREAADGRFQLIEAAIADRAGTARLAIPDTHDIWSSTSAEFIERNEAHGVQHDYVEVRATTFDEVLEKTGIPYYLKIDIEGMDMLPVRALRSFEARPRYVSIESNVSANDAPFERVFDELAELWTLGYRAFQYVNQLNVPRVALPYPALEGRYVEPQFKGDESGPFGAELAGRWLTVQRALMCGQLLRVQHNLGGFNGRWRGTPAGRAFVRARHRLGRPRAPWYDLHARLAPVN